MAAHGLLLLGETPERRLFVGVGLDYVREVGYLHDVVRSLWGQRYIQGSIRPHFRITK